MVIVNSFLNYFFVKNLRILYCLVLFNLFDYISFASDSFHGSFCKCCCCNKFGKFGQSIETNKSKKPDNKKEFDKISYDNLAYTKKALVNFRSLNKKMTSVGYNYNSIPLKVKLENGESYYINYKHNECVLYYPFLLSIGERAPVVIGKVNSDQMKFEDYYNGSIIQEYIENVRNFRPNIGCFIIYDGYLNFVERNLDYRDIFFIKNLYKYLKEIQEITPSMLDGIIGNGTFYLILYKLSKQKGIPPNNFIEAVETRDEFLDYL